MRVEHVAVLACVACGGGVRLEAQETASDGHVLSGRLACEACGRDYAVRDGVPRMASSASTGAVGQTIDAFGYQWEHATALFDARFSSPEVFLDFIRPVTQEWFVDKAVLDAGCGSGRFLLLSAAFGARLAVGVDLSSAVDVAFARTRHLLPVLVVQGDVLRLPVRRVLDYAFSVGVLHHTANPRAAFLEMATKVVPAGGVSAWVYGAENNAWVLRLLNPARAVTSRLPRRLLLVLSYLSAVPLTLVTHGIYGPVSRRPSLASWRSRLFYFEYLAFLSQFGYREHAMIVFDHAVPAIAEYIARSDFAEWFEAAGLEQVRITDRAGNSWRGFGRVAI